MSGFTFSGEQIDVNIQTLLDKINSKAALLQWALDKEIFLDESMLTKKYLAAVKKGEKRFLMNSEIKKTEISKTPFVTDSSIKNLWVKVKADPVLLQYVDETQVKPPSKQWLLELVGTVSRNWIDVIKDDVRTARITKPTDDNPLEQKMSKTM